MDSLSGSVTALHQAPRDLRTIGERLDQIEREVNDIWTALYKIENTEPAYDLHLPPRQEARLR